MGRWLPMVAVSGAGTLESVAPVRPLNPAVLRPRPDWGAFPARTIRPVRLARATLPAVVAETDSKQWDRPDAPHGFGWTRVCNNRATREPTMRVGG
jgi:hypothetical protein